MRYFSIFLILSFVVLPSFCMEGIDIEKILADGKGIFETDKIETMSAENSRFSSVFDVSYFETEQARNKIDALNEVLGFHHLRLTFEKKPHAIEAIINLVQTSHINSGQEDITPLHRVTMPHNLNEKLPDKWNVKVNEKRLHALKEFAIEFKEKNQEILSQAHAHNLRKLTFSDIMKYHFTKSVKKQIKSEIASEISQTLAQSFIHHFDSKFGSISLREEAPFVEVAQNKMGLYQEAEKLHELQQALLATKRKYQKANPADEHAFLEKFEQIVASF